MARRNLDYVEALLEEIALEGLEGITIEALWTRLIERPNFIFRPENDEIKSFLWNAVIRLAKVEFYELPTPRKPLVVFCRSELIDNSGRFIEPEDTSKYSIYEHKAVNKNGEMGSCSTYDERVKVSNDVRTKTLCEAVERWGNSLVVVASQDVRRTILINPDSNPLTELTVMQYCVLERIGRSRYQGELTQGKLGLLQVADDPKMLFYFRKYLDKKKLITKQLFYLKNGKYTATGSLLHLPRFSTVIKQKVATDAEKLIDYLKAQPGQYILHKNISDVVGSHVDVRKLLHKNKWLKTEVVPYRQIYPSAKPSEWKVKSNTGEKHIRIIKLLQNAGDSDDDTEEEDEGDEEQTGFLNPSERKLDRVLVRQCYTFIEMSGPRGLSQTALGQLIGLPSLLTRSVCKYMVKNKMCGIAFVDIGRQRVSHFYSKKYDSSKFALKNELIVEKLKLLQTAISSTQPKINKGVENSKGKLLVLQQSSMDSPPAKKLKADENLECLDRPRSTSEEDGTIETEIIVSQTVIPSDKGFPTLTGVGDGNEAASNLTLTILKRANLILQAVNTHRVIHDPQKLQKIINEEEESEGARHSVDRKTVQRLIDKLETDGHLKTIKVNIKGHGKERNMTFICHPTVDQDNPEIQSAIEQAKMKLPIITRETFKRKQRTSIGNKEEVMKMPTYKYDQKAGKTYGLKPKFVRTKLLHTYMYYLVYGYEGDKTLNQEEAKKQILKSLNLERSLPEEMSTVYISGVNWKMFIPPLPTHEGEVIEGWSLVSDLLLRLPLSIFVSIINVPYVIPSLMDFLNHPIKKHYLVRNLPTDIANHLTYNRKYIFSVSEIITRLAHIGLVQMGPQKLKEKDQVFIYLNKHAVLLDTTKSEPGYNHVSSDIDYEQFSYHFTNKEALEQYWHDLWHYAMNTNLGCRKPLTGHSVVIESINTKKALLPCIQPRNFNEAVEYDVGYLPGDLLGAGGIDSDLFVHLKRSWYWPSPEKSDETAVTDKAIIDTPTVKVISSRSHGKKRVISEFSNNMEDHVLLSEESSKPKKPKEDVPETPLISKKENFIQKHKKGKRIISSAKHKKITRLVTPKTMRFGRKPYYDQKDKEALRRMDKLRVDWSSKEDNLLLICKVASLYMTPNKRRQVAKNFCAVREILHSTYPELSRNKTSRACQRRQHYMMKNNSTAHSVYMCLEEIKQDPEISDKFSRAVEKLDAVLKAQGEGPKGFQKEYDKIFNNLVHTLLSKLKTITNTENTTLDNVSIPDSLEEFRKKYAVVFPKNFSVQHSTFNEVQNSVDILCSVVNTVLHSSLCCTSDKTSYSYQLFHVYKQYPDKLLRSVLAKCRSMSIISCRRNYKRWKSATNGCLPLSSSPYQLSITYVNILQTRYQYPIFTECFRGLKYMVEETEKQKNITNDINVVSEPRDEIKQTTSQIISASEYEGNIVLDINNGGECANIVELYSSDCMKMEIEFPEQLIVLDPRLTKTEESYKLIVKRFRELISMIKGTSSKNSKQALHSEEEEDEEDDDEMNISKTKNVSEEENIEEDFNLSNKSGIVNPATRLALYLMRDEPLENMDQSLQHAHDLFVLKPCKITVKLNKKKIEELTVKDEFRNEIISEIRRLCVFPEGHHETDAIISALNLKNNLLHVKLLKFLEEKKELGATYKDIEDHVERSKSVELLLSTLVQKQFILKSGSVSVRFVHNKFTKPWLIRSYFIPRYKREELGNENTNTSYALSLSNNEDKSIIAENEIMVDHNNTDNVNKECNDDKNEDKLSSERSRQESSERGANESSRVIMRTKRRKWMTLTKDSLHKFGDINFASLQPVHVSIRPWIRVDGTLNRRVLDRLLGAVLGHCLGVPGTTLVQLQKRFTPALQPVHTLELVDMLKKIGCVRTMVIKRSLKSTLFSDYVDTSVEEASGFDNVNDVFVEVELLAISRLGQFIGNKAYVKDYLDALTDSKMLSYA